MQINKNIPLGMVHISLPFKSMDDVQFSGVYAPVADALVQTLQEHLKKNQPEDSDESDDSNDNNNSDEEGSDNNDTENFKGPSMNKLRLGLPYYVNPK